MEQRHQQIRERAGLEEARLNVEFIDFLRKWGPIVLTIAAIAAGGQFVWTKLKTAKVDKINRAFDEYNKSAMTSNPSPLALKAVADEFNGVRGIGLMARLDAADAYLRSVRAGLKPGATLKPDGSVETKDDLLSEQDRATYLTEAEALYNAVLTETSASPDHVMMSVSALYGLAAVAESRQETDKAKVYYEQIAAKVEGGPYAYHATVAKNRIAELPKLAQLPKLYTIAELPKIKGVDPEPPPPAPAPGPAGPAVPGDVTAPTPTGQPIPASAPTDVAPEAVKPDAPKPDAPKPDAPKPDAPKPKSEPPKSESPTPQPGTTPPPPEPK
ncbi:MAG: hypothetical protein IT436_15200 [Phycisphaerales bacterium]|nr:hypothetical protein [Phycisphaerales bacterium]